MRIPFTGGSYQLKAKSFAVQRSINLMPILPEVPNTKSMQSLQGTAGLELYTTVGNGAVRGDLSSTSGRMFFVSGSKFSEIIAGVETVHGTINTSTGRVSIAENKTQIMIVDGVDGWIFTKATDGFVQITDGDFPVCSVVSYQDGYFQVFEDGTQKFYISALNDGTNWDALDFTSVEASPDDLTSIISYNGNTALLGNRSIEIYQNTGNADFPFERIAGAIIPTGCVGGFAVARFDNSIAWLGKDEDGDGVIWILEGYQAKRISTHAIEERISQATNLANSYMWVYHEDGHIFLGLQIDDLDTTIVYDGSTGLFHERSFHNPTLGVKEQQRASTVSFFDGDILVGDRENGNIYKMSTAYLDDAGDEILRERIAPHLQDEKRLVSYGSFELDMEVGVGLVTGQGSDPQIMMQYSDDGGFTWSDELWRTMGAIGKYNTRVIWRSLGQSRDRVFRVRISDPVEVQMNDAYLNSGA